jgi:hypothetical protein
MRYTILRYVQTSEDIHTGYIAPINITVYSSFEEAEKELQYLFVMSQSLRSESINTTDKSAHVWKSMRQMNGKDYVIITREDNPFFAIACLILAKKFTWYEEPTKRYWEPLFNMIRDYLARTTDRPELFKDLNR